MGVRNASSSVDPSDKSGVEELERLFLEKYSVEWEETGLSDFVYSAVYRVQRIEETFWH